MKTIEEKYNKMKVKVQNLQDKNREINSENRYLKRLFNKYNSIDKLLEKHIENVKINKTHIDRQNIQNVIQKKVEKTSNVYQDDGLFMVVSDVHAGKWVSKTYVPNEFNMKVLESRFNKLVDETIMFPYQSKKLNILFLGDMIEGIIHNGQFKNEEGVIASIYKLTEVIMKELDRLYQYYEEIDIYCIGGNHGRLQQDEYTFKKGEDFEFVLYKNIELLCKPLYKNINVNISMNGYHLLEKNGSTMLLFHGDQDNFKPYHLSQMGAILGKSFNIYHDYPNHLISGHIHHPMVIRNSFGGWNITNGCLTGADDYSHTNGFAPVDACQTIFYLDKDGDITNFKQILFKKGE